MNLPGAWDPTEMFPITGNPITGGNQVFWKDAETAYKTYVSIGGGSGQSLKRVAKRGGFSRSEFAYYFKGLCPTGPNKWPVKSCPNCGESGEIVDSEEGGIVFKCGVCMGAGVVVPDELPPCRKMERTNEA